MRTELTTQRNPNAAWPIDRWLTSVAWGCYCYGRCNLRTASGTIRPVAILALVACLYLKALRAGE